VKQGKRGEEEGEEKAKEVLRDVEKENVGEKENEHLRKWKETLRMSKT
jgi:hypothetical protein